MASFAWVLAILCAPTGCTRAVESSGERLADLIPIVEQGVSTDIILPPYRESLELLGHGWEEATAAFAREHGLWVLGRAGGFRFYSATEGPVTLEAEATTLSTRDVPQGVEVFLNGQSVDPRIMAREWSRYEFSLPASDVQVGWNAVELRFDQALRPTDIDSESTDTRHLAARFRRLSVRSGTGRTPRRTPRILNVDFDVPAPGL